MFFYFIKRRTAPEAVVKMLNSIPVSPDLVLLQPAYRRPSPHHPLFPGTDPGSLNSFPLALSAFLVVRLLSYMSPTNLRRTVYQGLNSLGFRVATAKWANNRPAKTRPDIYTKKHFKHCTTDA